VRYLSKNTVFKLFHPLEGTIIDPLIFRPTENIFKVQQSSTQWDPISFTVGVKITYDEIQRGTVG